MRFSIFLLIPLILLASCGGLNVEKTPLEEPQQPPRNASPSPVGLNKIAFSIPTGTPTVSQSPKGLLGWLNCDATYGLVEQGARRGRGYPPEEMREIFYEVLLGQGYDVTGSPGRMFDEEEDIQRTVYSVGGRITDIKIDTCKRTNFWGLPQGETGEGNIEVEWSVFDLLSRKTVYKTTTKGYGKLKIPNYEGIQLLFEDALASSVHNLGADPAFYDLVFFGKIPESTPETYEDPNENSLTIFNPRENITAVNIPLSNTPAEGRFDDILQSAVVIQKVGHGSGFFISPDGHILTNAHVVGNAQRMRIITKGKNHKLVAEVLRLDRRRDVAVLKLESIPDDLTIKTLPLRLEKPPVGVSVYAAGAPLRTQLQDTITKGIISTHRFDKREKQYYIQADVEVHPGNSGGMLLDENGNIIGMTVSGYGSDDGFGIGLNNFIPIADALEKLDIAH
jgi:S1-C subfamily serine protease